jgi:hypothetical protein
MQQENFKKNIALLWKITNFDRHTELFEGDSMDEITLGCSEVYQLNSPIRTAW